MDKSAVKKICPLPTELSEIKKNIPCTEEGCNRMFLNSSNLDMHLLKHHKKINKQFLKLNNSQIQYQYHCPVEKCSYNKNSERFFKNMKYLKQHFLKVHAEKNFYCEKCQKGYSTEAAKNKHERMCGMKFTCSCNYSYDSYEALITHAKRHQHTFDEKFKSYGKETSVPTVADNSNNNNCMGLPKDLQTTSTTIAVPVHLLAAVALSELSGKSLSTAVDKGVQTEVRNVDNKKQRKTSNFCKNSERSSKRRTSTQTQTGSVGRNKHPKISTETQTMGDSILKKAMKAADIPVIQKELSDNKKAQTSKKRRKSMETQTVSQSCTSVCDNTDELMSFTRKYSPVMNSDINFAPLNQFPSPSSYTNLCNNAYQLDIDVELPDLWIGEKNSSGTQTSPIALNTLMEHEEMLSHSVAQTDINLSLFDAEACEPSSSNIHSSSQTMTSLQSYFEDTSDSSFVPEAIIPSVPFGPELSDNSCGRTIDPLTLSDEPGYSSEQIDSILTRNTNMIFDESKSCSIETQTEIDISNSFYQCTDDSDTSFTLCSNIETQTTEDLSSLDSLLYSNMCTQTCDDFLFSDLGFVDIETQTAGDNSSLVSTETQTALSGCSNSSNSCKPWFMGNSKLPMSETSHMETQTNVSEFREFIAALVKQDAANKLL